MVISRFFAIFFGIAFVASGTIIIGLLTKGYRPDFATGSIKPTGLLVATSLPEAAQIYVDGELKSATDTTISLSPGSYDVEIQKQGYNSWKKTLTLEGEIVTRADAWLFPKTPSLRAVTTEGAAYPSLSPDGNKIAYIKPSKNSSILSIVDLTESPLGFINRDSRDIITIQRVITNLIWSPDSSQILAQASQSGSLVSSLVDISSKRSSDATLNESLLIETWQKDNELKNEDRLRLLPKELAEIIKSSTKDVRWSPREDRLMYLATASAQIATNLIPTLPGSNTQQESRSLEPGNVYIYDIEEDKNFQIHTQDPKTKDPKNPWQWFSSSRHIYKVQSNSIQIKEYDNTNETTIYNGPMSYPQVFPYPSGKQMLILTNLNPDLSPLPNLYAVSLR